MNVKLRPYFCSFFPHKVNNLYGKILTMKLPLSSFEVIRDPEIIAQLDFEKMTPDDTHGYFIMGDWHYPEHLHEQHQDLPLLPDLQHINFEKLSPYCRMMLAKGYPDMNPTAYEATKLTCNFEDKYNYLTHYLHAQLCLQQGLILKRIKYVIKFRQEAFVKEYIETCTRLRKTAKDPFFRDVYKLMANSVRAKHTARSLFVSRVKLHLFFPRSMDDSFSTLLASWKCILPASEKRHYVSSMAKRSKTLVSFLKI